MGWLKNKRPQQQEVPLHLPNIPNKKIILKHQHGTYLRKQNTFLPPIQYIVYWIHSRPASQKKGNNLQDGSDADRLTQQSKTTQEENERGWEVTCLPLLSSVSDFSIAAPVCPLFALTVKAGGERVSQRQVSTPLSNYH